MWQNRNRKWNKGEELVDTTLVHDTRIGYGREWNGTLYDLSSVQQSKPADHEER